MTATISGDGTSTLINLTTSGNTVLGDASTDTLNVGNGGLVKDASGNVGIGTASPNSKLEVTSRITASDDGGASRIALNIESNTSAQTYSGINSYNYGTSAARNLVLNESGGSVGIGTISPSRKLVVSNAGAQGFEFGAGVGAGSGNEVLNYNRSTSLYIPSSAYASTHTFYAGTAGGTRAVDIDSSGNLLVGTTSNTSFSARLCLSYNSGTTNWAIGPWVTTPTNFYISANSGVQGVYLNGSTATSWTAWSDERLKTDLQPIENAVEKVSSLRAVTGIFIGDETNTRKPFLIAQDVLSVLPEAVDTSDSERFGLSYTDVIPLLVAAIKEQQAIITQLQADVEALKAQP